MRKSLSRISFLRILLCLGCSCVLIHGMMQLARRQRVLNVIRNMEDTDSESVIGGVRIIDIPDSNTSVSVGVVTSGLRRGAVFVLHGESAQEIVYGAGSAGIDAEIVSSVEGNQVFAFIYREGSGMVRQYIGIILVGEQRSFWRLEIGRNQRVQLLNDESSHLAIRGLDANKGRNALYRLAYIESNKGVDSQFSHGTLVAICEHSENESATFDLVTSF